MIKTKSLLQLAASLLAIGTAGGLLGVAYAVQHEIEPSPTATTTLVMHQSVLARDITVYARAADAIVIGTVKDVHAPRFQPGVRFVERSAIVDVTEEIKGSFPDGTVTVALPGGTAQGLTVLVEDSAELAAGERVLLFLGTNTANEYVIFAGPLGKYALDGRDIATSPGDFKMPLAELQSEIFEALDLKPDAELGIPSDVRPRLR